MTFWFGFPGNMRRLYDPMGGALVTRVIDTSVFNGSVGARVEKSLNGVRQYTLSYGALGRENFNYMNAFHQGHMGPGPFALVDLGRLNMLTSNQSSGSSTTNDTRDFTVVGASTTLTSDNTLTTPFPRTLKWSFTANTPGTEQLYLNKPSSVWPGIPVVPNQAYTFWFMVLGGTGPIDINLRIEWLNAAGSQVSTVTSSNVTTSTSVWKQVFVTATPPATAAYMGPPMVTAVSSSIGTGESLFMTSFMLTPSGTVTSQWHPGTGVYPVQTIDLPEKYGFKEPGMLVSPTWTLQEVV